MIWVSKIDRKSYHEFVLIEFRSIFVIFFILLQSLPLTGCPFFESFIFIMNGNNYEQQIDDLLRIAFVSRASSTVFFTISLD